MDSTLETFQAAVDLFNSGMYWDSIEVFEAILDAENSEDLADDISLNIAINFMHLSLFDQAKSYFQPVYEGSVGNGVFDAGDNNVGKTSSRAALGLFRIALACEQYEEANRLLTELNEDKSGISTPDGFVRYFEIAQAELNLLKAKL